MDKAAVMEAIGGFFATFVIFGIILGLLLLALLIFLIITYIKLYKKSGQAGWEAIIPYYSSWIECKITGCHWIVFIAIIANSALSLFNINLGRLDTIFSLLSTFGYVATTYNLSKKFNKDTGFFVGMLLLPIVFIPILAFSNKEKYDKNVKVKNCAFFDVNF